MSKKYPQITFIKNYLLLACSFFISFGGKIALYPFIFYIFFGLIEGKFKSKFNLVKKNKIILLLPLLYVFYLLGLIHTENFDYANEDLEIKFALFLFPIVIIPELKSNTKLFNFSLISYVLGCTVNLIICYWYADYNLLNDPNKDVFFSSVSLFMHRSYLSMYVCFAIVILLHFFLADKIKLLLATLYIIFFLFLSGSLFVLNSKAGLISFFIILLCFIGVYLIKKKRKILAFFMLLAITIPFLFIDKIAPNVYLRFKLAAQVFTEIENEADGTVVRLRILQNSKQLVVDNFFIGTGTGDVKDELIKMYNEKDLCAAFDNKLNAHNQFLQTLITLGFIGLILLLMPIFYLIYLGFKNKEILFLSTGIILVLFFLTESMLETQAGVFFFSFSISMLFKKVIIDVEISEKTKQYTFNKI